MAAQTTGTAAAAMLSPNPATASLELAFHVVLAAEQRKAALKDKGQRMRRAPMQGVTNGTARAAVPSATAPEPQPRQTRSFSARVVNLDDLPSVADEVHSVAMVGHPPFQAARLLDLGSEGLTRSSLEAPVGGSLLQAGACKSKGNCRHSLRKFQTRSLQDPSHPLCPRRCAGLVLLQIFLRSHRQLLQRAAPQNFVCEQPQVPQQWMLLRRQLLQGQHRFL